MHHIQISLKISFGKYCAVSAFFFSDVKSIELRTHLVGMSLTAFISASLTAEGEAASKAVQEYNPWAMGASQIHAGYYITDQATHCGSYVLSLRLRVVLPIGRW